MIHTNENSDDYEANKNHTNEAAFGQLSNIPKNWLLISNVITNGPINYPNYL